MKPLKLASALMKDEPLTAEERLDRLERETSRKLGQFEEALGVFKDIVVKLYDEKEELKTENISLKESLTKTATGIKDTVKETIVQPLSNAGEGFVELLMENNDGEKSEPKVLGNQNSVSFNPNTDEMERTIAWMREKFGLPANATSEVKQAKSKKKRK